MKMTVPPVARRGGPEPHALRPRARGAAGGPTARAELPGGAPHAHGRPAADAAGRGAVAARAVAGLQRVRRAGVCGASHGR